MVMDINPGKAAANPRGGALINNMLFFGARDDKHGAGLWVTDSEKTDVLDVWGLYK